MLRVSTGGEDAVEIAMPPYVRARAEEIARLSRELGDRGSGFSSSREVLAPALVYGLAHMQERYRQAAGRRSAPFAYVREPEEAEREEAGPDVRQERDRDHEREDDRERGAQRA
jgi:hypothetical protein